MSNSKPAGYWLTTLVAVLCLGVVACGSVGEPLPPLLDIPGHVEDFTVRQELEDLVATWTWPVHGSEGQIFRDMDRFEVYAACIPPAGAIPSIEAFNSSEDRVRTVSADSITDGGPGVSISVRAPLDARYGSRFGFAVRGVSSRGKVSAWSAVQLLDFVSPPAVPVELRVETTEPGVRLNWSAVEGAADYEIERRVGDGAFVAVGETTNMEFLDASTAWGLASAYRVRARKTAGDSPMVAGEPSTRFEIVPVDRFSPTPPRELRAISTARGVELSWASNAELDLAGYRVLRGGDPIHDGLLEAANYSAPVIADGLTLVYQVVSVDLSGNVSAPTEVRASAAP